MELKKKKKISMTYCYLAASDIRLLQWVQVRDTSLTSHDYWTTQQQAYSFHAHRKKTGEKRKQTKGVGLVSTMTPQEVTTLFHCRSTSITYSFVQHKPVRHVQIYHPSSWHTKQNNLLFKYITLLHDTRNKTICCSNISPFFITHKTICYMAITPIWL